MSESAPPRLAPPGAGVPVWQRLCGKHVLLPLWRRRHGWDAVPAALEEQGRRLIDRAAGIDAARLARRVLVPRQIGLEDSSRWYSWAMVLEHLTIVGDRTAEIVVDLTRGRAPARAVRTAELKPEGRLAPAEAVEAYRAMLERFRRRTLEEARDRQSPLRHLHPWFGPLAAGDWMTFAPMHQAIHVIQARRILERLSAATAAS